MPTTRLKSNGALLDDAAMKGKSIDTQKRKRDAPSTPPKSTIPQPMDPNEESELAPLKKQKKMLDPSPSKPNVSPSKKLQKTPSKKTKATPKQSPEKRLRRHRDRPTQSYLEKLSRAQTQRMFVIDRTPGGSPECPEKTIAMAGTTGNIYNVRIAQIPSCTCPDHLKGNQCKHIIYVLHNVLKAPEDLQYQLAFLSTELQTIFTSAPSPLASASWSSEKSEEGGSGVKQRPVEGDCPICFMPFASGEGPSSDQEIVYCRAACGNNIHADCFEQWAKSQAGKDVRCVYCRTVWEGDQEQIMRIVKQKMKSGLDGEGPTEINGEGYVNVASELGLSGARGELSVFPFLSCRLVGMGDIRTLGSNGIEGLCNVVANYP